MSAWKRTQAGLWAALLVVFALFVILLAAHLMSGCTGGIR
jgi:hypothetical protein